MRRRVGYRRRTRLIPLLQFQPEIPKLKMGFATDKLGFIYGLEKSTPPPPPNPAPVVESRKYARAVRVDVQFPVDEATVRVQYVAHRRAGFFVVGVHLPNGEIHTAVVGAKEFSASEKLRRELGFVADLTSIGGNLGELIGGDDGRWIGSVLGLVGGIGIAANRN